MWQPNGGSFSTMLCVRVNSGFKGLSITNKRTETLVCIHPETIQAYTSESLKTYRQLWPQWQIVNEFQSQFKDIVRDSGFQNMACKVKGILLGPQYNYPLQWNWYAVFVLHSKVNMIHHECIWTHSNVYLNVLLKHRIHTWAVQYRIPIRHAS